MKNTAIILSLLICLFSCRTTKISEKTELSQHNDVHTAAIAADVREAHSEAEYVEKAAKNIVTDETVIETVWSVPDTANKQYKVATRETVRRSAIANTRETVALTRSDTTSKHVSETIVDDKTVIEVATETVATQKTATIWDKIVNILILIGVVAIIIWIKSRLV